MTILDKVREIVAEGFGEPLTEIRPETHFVKDLHASLDFVEVVLTCEEVFNIAISDEDAEKLETVGQLAAYIESQLEPSDTVWPPPPKGFF